MRIRHPFTAAPIVLARSIATAGMDFAAAAAADGPAKRPITHEDLWSMRRVGSPAPSPDGRWVVFAVTEPSYDDKSQVSDLWVAPTDGSTPPRRLTKTPGRESGVDLSPDGSRIASCGDDLRIWDGQHGELLAQLDDLGRNDVLSACTFSPDGTLLATGSQQGQVQLRDVHLETRSSAVVHQELLAIPAYMDADQRLRKSMLQMIERR